MNAISANNQISIEFKPFEDPITHEEIKKAVLLPCGHTFGEESIAMWLSQIEHQSCPSCKNATNLSNIKPDYGLRSAIEKMPNLIKKLIREAVESETQNLKSHFQKQLEIKEREIKISQLPTGPAIVVDYKRIITDAEKRTEIKLQSNIVLHLQKYRYLALHVGLTKRVSFKFEDLLNLYTAAELAQQNGLGQTALVTAIKNYMIPDQIINAIINKMNIEDFSIQDAQGNTALHHSAINRPDFLPQIISSENEYIIKKVKIFCIAYPAT